MHIIYLEKNILLDNIISEINLINIDEDIQYLHRNDGILIKGNINVEGEYLSLGVNKNFYDYLNVSILVPYENIITDELQFKLLDFDYIYNNNNLNFSFKINIEGYKEIEKSFQDETEEVEIVSNIDVSIDDVKNILNNKNIVDKIDEDEPITIEDDNEEDIPFDEGERLEFNISGIEDNIINNEDEVINEPIKKESFLNKLFKKEKKKKLYKYRVILEDDDYESIAKEYNINLFELKEINNNSILELGKIIKIPLKNE